ncbi:MAG: hypothetical protein NC177_08495 [Ruminococcus flavefaciens]|nr:hypothetical protein [Ruminococcus flavefaciens]
MNRYETFRKKYPLFIYRSYSIAETENTVDVSYEFSVPELANFRPSWSFPKPENITVSGDMTFERLVFSLGMAEAVSYWKAVCSPEMHIECSELSPEQVQWWKKLYFSGLGEFFYVNEINADFDDFITIKAGGAFSGSIAERPELLGCLVAVGGGKDSALTLETLTSAGMKCMCYGINKRCSITATVTTAGLPETALITARRNFDRSLVEYNKKGFLNGHTPFSSVVAFSAEITAYLHRLKYIVLSNESSANESTVIGQNVNHQYSKSFEFEKDFHEYEEKYLKTGIYYFSFLRPLSEFQIAGMFSAHRNYLPVFRSCNLGSKVSPDIWCGECPKCLFVSLILSPFLTDSELAGIFGKDLLNDESMTEYFIELIGKSAHKPFECVGSVDEVNLSVSLAIRKRIGGKLPLLFEYYVKQGFYNPENLDEKYNEYRKYFNNENLLPDSFREILLNEMGKLL